MVQNMISYMTYSRVSKLKMIMDIQSKVILSPQPKLYYKYLNLKYINSTKVILNKRNNIKVKIIDFFINL